MSEQPKITWPGIVDTFRLSAKNYLSQTFSVAFAKFKPRGFVEEMAMGQAPGRFQAWIDTLSEKEADAIRREMIEALGGYVTRD